MRKTTNPVGDDLEIFADAINRALATHSFEVVQCLEPMFAKVTMTLQSLPSDVSSLPVGGGETAVAGGVGGANVASILPAPGTTVAQPQAPAAVVVTAVLGVVAVGTDIVFALQGCRSSDRIVVCEDRVNNSTGQDHNVVVQARQAVLYDANGGAYYPDDVRMGNQRGRDA